MNSQDFVVLKNAATKSRKLDPDIPQIIERLARRGLSPLKEVKLISDKKDSAENKKWQWLLKKLNIRNVELLSLDEYIKNNKPLRPKPEPEKSEIWSVDDIKSIFDKADMCFVNWSTDNYCL